MSIFLRIILKNTFLPKTHKNGSQSNEPQQNLIVFGNAS